MLYVDNFDRIKQRFNEYWAHENADRPLVYITAPRKGAKAEPLKAPDTLERCWLDTEYTIKKNRQMFAMTAYGAEAFPIANPNLGPDIFGATFGTDIVFEKDTSYSVPIIEHWDNHKQLVFDKSNRWWQSIVDITKSYVDDAKGDYFVGITDLHPGADGLVSLRGPEKLCMDLFDNPDRVKTALTDILPAFQYQLDTLYDITKHNLGGSSNWMNIWHPEKWYVVSSDFICMISEDMFEEFIVPELLMEIDLLKGNSIFHLDGPGSLKHLDTILEIPNIAGVQWVYGAGQPTAAHWIDVLKKIQAKGKLINIAVTAEDIDEVMEHIEPNGVYFDIGYVHDEDEMNAILKRIDGNRKKKVR